MDINVGREVSVDSVQARRKMETTFQKHRFAARDLTCHSSLAWLP
jgi:hypothetical protein